MENIGNKAMADFMEGIGHRFILQFLFLRAKGMELSANSGRHGKIQPLAT